MLSYFGGIVVVAVVAGRALTVLKKKKQQGNSKGNGKKRLIIFIQGIKQIRSELKMKILSEAVIMMKGEFSLLLTVSGAFFLCSDVA